MFKSIRGKFGSKTSKQNDDVDGPYKRQTRSMDVQGGPFMSQPVLGLQMEDATADYNSSRTMSSTSNSPTPLVTPTWDTLSQARVGLTKAESMPGQPRPNNNNTTIVVTTSQNSAPRLPDIVVSDSLIQVEDIPYSGRGQAGIPSSDNSSPPVLAATFNIPNARRVSYTSSPGSGLLSADAPRSSRLQTIPQSLPSSAQGTLTDRSTVPPIADMPPALRLHREGSVRLSPAIITRAPTRPLPGLPRMPEPSDDPQSPQRPQSRLRSMPALSVDG